MSERAQTDRNDAASPGSILLVEDEHRLRKTLARSLVARGYRVDEAATVAEAAGTTWRCSTSICPTPPAGICREICANPGGIGRSSCYRL